MCSMVAHQRSAWLQSTGFLEVLQASLMDMPFDGSRLFVDKADVALELFRESGTARSLDLSTAPAIRTLPLAPPVATTECFSPVHSTSHTHKLSRLPVTAAPTDPVDTRDNTQPSPPPHRLPQPPNPFGVSSTTHSHPVGGRICYFLS